MQLHGIGIIKWFHHLFNPHCNECRLDAQRELEVEKEDRFCPNCKVMMELLENERTEKRMLLEKLLPKDKVVVEDNTKQYQATPRFRAPGSVLRQLEMKSHIEQQERLKQAQVTKEVEDLEKELGVGHEGAVEK